VAQNFGGRDGHVQKSDDRCFAARRWAFASIAQNGLPTGDQSPVAGGANGGQWGWYAGSVYGYSANRFEYYPSYGYEQYPAYGYRYGNRY
jgi:hypothetical protein